MTQKVQKDDNRNSTLNLLKGLGCIGVIFIHIVFPGKVGEIILTLSNFAVPIFIMIAGYYAFGCNESAIKRRFCKILKIFIFAYFFFLAYNVFAQAADGNLVEWLKANYTLKNLVKYIIFCNIDFAIPLWYLIAMLETYLLWMVIVKYNKESSVIKFIPIFFLYQILLSIICEINQYDWYVGINFVAKAMPWFLFGYFAHTICIDKIYNGMLFSMLIIGVIVTLISHFIYTPINFSYIGLIPYAMSLFLLAIKYPQIDIFKPVGFIGDKLSLNIYIFHVLIAKVIEFVLKFLGISTDTNVFLWIYPIIITSVSIIFSYCVYKINSIFKKKKVDI